MREERGQLSGEVLVFEPFTLWGSVGGNVRVIQGGKFYLRGAIYGDLTVEFGGRVHIYGNLTGNLVVERGAKVIHSGIIGRDIVNQGGRLYIETNSRVLGRIRPESGETTIEPGFKTEDER
jgi:cytoskeletal protein CcmA (bactofilin family)